MRLPLLTAFGLMFAGASLPSEPPGAAALREGAIPLYDRAPPAYREYPTRERWYQGDNGIAVRNVAEPTVKPFLPVSGKGNGAAVVVIPGGAFLLLSMENEGAAAARALAARGYAAFLLKYRTEPTPADDTVFSALLARLFDPKLAPPKSGDIPGQDAARQDVEAALRLVRGRAKEFGVDPARIGVIGFSAGAMTVRNVVLADAPDTRPAFAGMIYGQLLPRRVPVSAPPAFIVATADDPIFSRDGFELVSSWQTAGAPVEFHWYRDGGHGFGMRTTGTTSDGWFDAFSRWLDRVAIAR